MSTRRLAFPGTMQQNMSQTAVTQRTFGGGLNTDDPATEINPDELAGLFNKIAHSKYCRGRTGCKVFGTADLPTITFYDLFSQDPIFTASKTGRMVSLTKSFGGPNLDRLVEGQYLVWPDGTRDQIIDLALDTAFLTGSFESAFSGDRTESDSCVQQARIWGAGYSQQNEKIIVHLGTNLYFIGNDFSEYSPISLVGAATGEALAESRTRFDFDDDMIIAYNANGIYRIVFDEDSGYCFKMNNGQPTVRIHENSLISSKPYVRNRIYTALRLIGPGCLYGDRRTADVVAQQETAPTLPDAAHKDMSTGYTDIAVGPGASEYLELASGTGLETNVAEWRARSDGAFIINVNGLGNNIITNDFSFCTTMDTVATEIQRNLRTYYADAECYFRNTGGVPQLVINGGRLNGSTVGYVSASGGTSYTDVSDLMDMYAGSGTSGILTTQPVDAPQLTYGYYTEAQKNTHLGVYASKRAGEAGIDLGNIADELIWERDIPIIKALRVTVVADVATTSTGEKFFSKADEGSFFFRADDKSTFQLGPIKDDDGNDSANDFEANAGYAGGSSGVIAMGAKKVSQAYQIGDEVFFDSISLANPWNLLTEDDVGKILFIEDGSVRHILSVDVFTQSCKVHERMDFGTIGTSIEYLAVAWDPIQHSITANSGDDSKIIIFDKSMGEDSTEWVANRSSGDFFDASDEGKSVMIFKDGQYFSIGEVDAFTNENKVLITTSEGADWLATPDRLVYAIVTGFMPSRFFKDNVADVELASRSDDPYFLLQTRFFRPLPSSCIGALGSNFMFVCEEGTAKIRYSEMPQARKYIVGFYHPTWQAFSGIQDEITCMKSYPDRMIAFGKKATWGSNVSAFTSIKTPEIGEEIFTVPAFTLIENKGFTHLDSMQDIGSGQSLLMLSDASIRTFDGRQYSQQNLAEKKIHKALRLWHNRVMSSYDGNGGYMIFGSANVNSDTQNFVNMDTGACYRFAVLPSQGSWWTKYGGTSMVSPMPYSGGLSIYDENDMNIQVMLDERTGLWHQINTYNGPSGSGLVESFEDKDGEEIACSIKGMEHRGQKLSISLEHLESHIHIAPGTQGATFDADFEITSKIYVDNGVSYFAKTVDTPVDGDIVYDRKAQSKHLQSEFEFSMSDIMVSQIETIYCSKDTAGATAMDKRPTSESNYQREYGA